MTAPRVPSARDQRRAQTKDERKTLKHLQRAQRRASANAPDTEESGGDSGDRAAKSGGSALAHIAACLVPALCGYGYGSRHLLAAVWSLQALCILLPSLSEVLRRRSTEAARPWRWLAALARPFSASEEATDDAACGSLSTFLVSAARVSGPLALLLRASPARFWCWAPAALTWLFACASSSRGSRFAGQALVAAASRACLSALLLLDPEGSAALRASCVTLLMLFYALEDALRANCERSSGAQLLAAATALAPLAVAAAVGALALEREHWRATQAAAHLLWALPLLLHHTYPLSAQACAEMRTRAFVGRQAIALALYALWLRSGGAFACVLWFACFVAWFVFQCLGNERFARALVPYAESRVALFTAYAGAQAGAGAAGRQQQQHHLMKLAALLRDKMREIKRELPARAS